MPATLRTPEKANPSHDFVDTSDNLCSPADPNLSCPVCLKIFSSPVRTACGCALRTCISQQTAVESQPLEPRTRAHVRARTPLCLQYGRILPRAPPSHLSGSSRRRHVFCSECLNAWLPLKPECPECRAAVDPAAVSPDRLADRLVSNLRAFCTLRAQGCEWTGRRGEVSAHLARDCACVTFYCPNGCGAEVRRSELEAHLGVCTAAASIEGGGDASGTDSRCPYGCGAACGGAGQPTVEEHKAVCLLEPRKLMAAVSRLSLENERLALEVQQLRSREAACGHAEPQPTTATQMAAAGLMTPPGAGVAQGGDGDADEVGLGGRPRKALRRRGGPGAGVE